MHVCIACLLFLTPLSARGVTHRVDHAGGGDYLTIQEGINAASTGPHAIEWNATDQPSGVYFCSLTTEAGVESRTMVVIR